MKFGMIFPGQGSQHVGMLADLAQKRPEILSIFAEASELLQYDLWALVSKGPEAVLNQTERTQPALLVAGVATFHCWCEWGGAQPVYMAGHSLGEYTALVCAGALSLREAVLLVAQRGRYMQEAVLEGMGAMAALVGLEPQEIVAVCQEAALGQVVSPANYNSIGQTVVSGHREAVLRAIELAKERGAKLAKLIPVSVPSHCALMQPAVTRLRKNLAKVHLLTPEIPVVHNSDVKVHFDVEAIRQVLENQLIHPVRWVETIQWLAEQGVTQLFECGPGQVLTGLNKRITTQIHTQPLDSPEAIVISIGKIRGS